MTAVKKHTIKDIQAYYLKFGRQWVVEQKNEKNVFDTFESMIESFPILMKLPVMQTAFKRRKRLKFRPYKRKNTQPFLDKVPKVVTEKLVACYYCSGKGELSHGMLCPNCKGQKEILVTSKGFG
ncbi:hypothetical protein [Roseivirga sp.]|uniref:hypothetical protein n=1 Tax=Roseivirga sp. TaxID=1964215 RepID=UPI003B8C7964